MTTNHNGAARIEHAIAEPEPLRRPVPPSAPYPVDALGATLGPAARAIHEATKAPPALCAQSVLAAAGLAAQPHADVTIDGRTHPLSLWAISVADSGERKTAVDKLALAPHFEHERAEIARFADKRRDHQDDLEAFEAARTRAKQGKTREAIRNALAACGEPPVEPPSGILIVREPTIEAVQKLYLGGTASLGLFVDEGALWMGGHAMKQENAMRTVGALSKLWDDGSSDRIRSGDGASKIYNRRLAMHLLMQPVVAEGVLSDPLLAGQGFLARALITRPAGTAGTRTISPTDAPVNPAMMPALRAYHERIAALLAKAPTLRDGTRSEVDPRALKLTRAARTAWVAAYNAIERQEGPSGTYATIKPWASKGAEQVLRIAGVITLIDDPDAREIAAQTIEAASTLVEFYLGEALRLVDAASVSPTIQRAEKILAWCRDKGHALVSSRTLMQFGPASVRDDEKLTEAMGALERTGWAARAPKGTKIGDETPRRAWTVRIDTLEA